jgi:hypothetical protein
MYISNFQVSNYKSFSRSSQTVDLTSGMNIVTGQNNAGKTAFLEALDFARKGPVPHRSIAGLPSPTSIVEPDTGISLRVDITRREFVSHLAGRRFVLPLPLPNSPSQGWPPVPVMQPEYLSNFADWFFSRDEYNIDLRFSRKANGDLTCQVVPSSIFNYPIAPNANAIEVQSDSTRVRYFGPAPGGWRPHEDMPLVREFGLYFPGKVYRFAAARFAPGTHKFGDDSILAPNAANLPVVLGVLRTMDVAFDRYMEAVRAILPQIERITLKPNGERETILIVGKEAHQHAREDLAFPLDQSGTGIGQVLAILYVVLTSNEPQVILIDEPQSFLHPGAARKLIEVLKEHPEHQYVIATHSPTIITAANPQSIILVKHNGNESQLEHLDGTAAIHLRRYLDEIGASLADVFGADGIVWVEGPTEEKCYPLIVEKLIKQSLMGKVIKAAISTGDFEGKHAERSLQLYSSLSGAGSLIPPAVGFLFDDEGRTDQQKKELCHRGKHIPNLPEVDRVHFIKRRMFENYLLNTRAIKSALKTAEGGRDCAEQDIAGCIAACLKDEQFFKPLRSDLPRDANWVRADKVLSRIFWDLAEIEYVKTLHSADITEWLIENVPEDLAEIKDLLQKVLFSAAESGNR